MLLKSKKKFLFSFLLLILILMQAVFTSCSPPGVSFEDIVISEDMQKESGEPLNPSNEFNINSKRIVASVKYSGVKGTDNWRFKWINTDLNETILDNVQQFNKDQPDSYFHGIVSSDIYSSDQSKIIPPGSYRVEFYFNDSLLKTTTFKIAKPSTNIIEVFLSDEIDEFGKPINLTKQFKPHDTAYLSIRLDYAIAGNIIKAVWETSEQQFEESVLDIKTDYYDNSYIWFALSLPDKKYNIAPGFYAVKIFLNEKLYESLKFEVLKEDPPTFIERDFYNNDLFGFKFAIPDNWSYKESTENNIVFIELDPKINIPASFIITAAAAEPLKPYDEFIRAGAQDMALAKNWTFIETKKREYLLKNTNKTLELIYLYRDQSDKSCIAVYSITEYNENVLIYHILIEDEAYDEFAETVYFGILNSLTIEPK